MPTARKSSTRKASASRRPARWRNLAGQLLKWFDRHQRDLPWRRTRDPYHVWISEIMLQQTQVATVVPYFERFLTALPNLQALADADEHQVLRLWEGLGYYRRARQLHHAARVIRDEHAGQFPRTLEAVRALPGIGRYTAGAIVSIAYDRPAPILEANTLRLYCRLLAFRGDPYSSAGQHSLWQLAEDLLPSRRVGAFNQALMEVGSLLCTPRAPRCGECPLRPWCGAFQAGCQEEVPRPKPKPASLNIREAAVVVQNGDRVLVRRCQRGERWAGLWDFVRFAVESPAAELTGHELVRKTREISGLAVRAPRLLTTLRHTVTRYRITLDCYLAATSKRVLPEGQWRWVDAAELGSMPLSVTGRRLARLVIADQKSQ